MSSLEAKEVSSPPLTSSSVVASAMNSKARRTPTPYRVYASRIISARKDGREVFIAEASLDMHSASAREVAEEQKVKPLERDANAAFIVLDCNTFDSDQAKIAALLEAAKEGLAELETVQGLLAAIPGRMRTPWQEERLPWLADTVGKLTIAIAAAERT